jgi:hypothetical protein
MLHAESVVDIMNQSTADIYLLHGTYGIAFHVRRGNRSRCHSRIACHCNQILVIIQPHVPEKAGMNIKDQERADVDIKLTRLENGHPRTGVR